MGPAIPCGNYSFRGVIVKMSSPRLFEFLSSLAFSALRSQGLPVPLKHKLLSDRAFPPPKLWALRGNLDIPSMRCDTTGTGAAMLARMAIGVETPFMDGSRTMPTGRYITMARYGLLDGPPVGKHYRGIASHLQTRSTEH
jgi:hypothetical protein